MSRIWVLKLDDLSHVEIPKPPAGCNDTEPMWIGETVYFLSDRDGEFNVYSYDLAAKTVARCTDHDAFPMASASSGAGKLIYEQGGLGLSVRPARAAIAPAQDFVAADLDRDPAAICERSQAHSGASISPGGNRAVLGYRGEIVTVPAKKGDPRNLTQTPGAHERHPAWSPDGKSIAYLSDATGEYQLVIRPQDGKGDGKSFPIPGSGFYEGLVWSARQQEDRHDRQLSHPLLDRPRKRESQAHRRRADLRTETHRAHQLRLVCRLEVAGVLPHQSRRLPADLALLRRE